MKRFSTLLMLSLALTSCRIVKTNSTEDKRSSDSLVAHTAAQSDVKTTKETVDTVLTVRPDSLKGSAQITPSDQSKPDTPQVHELESDDIAVKATYNPRTGKLDIEARTKPKTIPVKFNREITESRTRSHSSIVATGKTSSHKRDETIKEPAKVPWYLNLRIWFWILFILTAIYVLIRNRVPVISLIRRVISRVCS
jgi:hypothetical protein